MPSYIWTPPKCLHALKHVDAPYVSMPPIYSDAPISLDTLIHLDTPHMFGCPHMFGHPIHLNVPYVWTPPVYSDTPICLNAPCMDTACILDPHMSECPHTSVYSPIYLYVSRGYLLMIWGWLRSERGSKGVCPSPLNTCETLT